MRASNCGRSTGASIFYSAQNSNRVQSSRRVNFFGNEIFQFVALIPPARLIQLTKGSDEKTSSSQRDTLNLQQRWARHSSASFPTKYQKARRAKRRASASSSR